MENRFFRLARLFWPELEQMSAQRRLVGVGDVLITLTTAPLALLGLIWLLAVTDLELIATEWQPLLLFGGLILIFNRFKYFFIIEIRTDRYGSAEGSLASMVQWTAAFLFGPTSLWLSVAGTILNYIWGWRRSFSKAGRWDQTRAFTLDLATGTLAYLISLALYQRWGGLFPLSNLSLGALLPASGALLVHSLVVIGIWSAYTLYAIWIQHVLTHSTSIKPIIKFFSLALGLPLLAHPFAILSAGLYVQNGLFTYLFFATGLVLVAYLTRQLSWAGESSRQQSRQLEKLERLSREILNSPLDASALSNLLEEHIPMMFPSGRVIIWLAPGQLLHKHPVEWACDIEPIWRWVASQSGARAFPAREKLPWNQDNRDHDPLVAAPILDVESAQAIGCIYIELRSLAQPWDSRALTSLFPAVHALADQVASALHQAQQYAESLEYLATLQELEFAGRIQASFLPNEFPSLEGWELAVTLLPARETSGDFFDIIPLEDGRVGILIADVADKGVGAALYMALTRTLIRTYALEYDSQPDIVFFSANERILQDARANLFVTAFYAVLDQETGALIYSNAGHNPPFLFSARDGGTIHALTTTGMPLGIDEDATWSLESIQIEPGDVLLLYTDGIPDAQNSAGEFFQERKLLEVAQREPGSSAGEIQAAILQAVQDFVGDAPQFDDITLLVLMRYPLEEQTISPEDTETTMIQEST